MTQPGAHARLPAYRIARSAYHGLLSLTRFTVHHTPVPWPYRARVQAARLGSDRKAALIAPDRSFMYVVVPKAANSTIKRVLWRKLGVEVGDEAAMRDLHAGPGPYDSFDDLDRPALTRLFRTRETFKFTFVRNPYTRLASAYRQKIHDLHAHEEVDYYLRNLRLPTDALPTFETFVRRIARQRDDHADIHWMSQTRCALTHMIDYDFIGKIETIDRDLPHVLERIGAPAGLYEPSLSLNRGSGDREAGPYSSVYTRALADLVFDRYRKDFEVFGYDRNSYA